MKLTKKTILVCATACALALGAWAIHAVRDYAQSGTTGAASRASVPPWVELDKAAVAARGGGQASIKELATEVVEQPSAFPHAPTELATPIVNRLVYGEMQYRSGHGKPVDENNIVPVVNDLVQKLGLPNWARVDSPQVRCMQVGAMAFNPIFMGEGAIRPYTRVGDSLSWKMSPLQAVHLALYVMSQKATNPNFQFAPGTWEAHQAALETQRLQAFQKGLLPAQGRHKPYLEAIQDLKTAQMMKAFRNAAAAITVEKALTMANHELDTLGIDRQEGAGNNE